MLLNGYSLGGGVNYIECRPMVVPSDQGYEGRMAVRGMITLPASASVLVA